MKWVCWYYKPLIPGSKVLKVWNRDSYHAPLVPGYEPIDLDVYEG